MEDGSNYTLVVATAKNRVSLMDKEKTNFSEPGESFIIVRKITKKLRSKRKLKRKVIVSTVLIYSLVLGGVKIRSSDSETAHSDNRTVVERVLDLSGGDQSKFGPGARAKFDAKANGGVRRMGQTASSSSSIFTES